MAMPTVEVRRQRKFIVMSTDGSVMEKLRDNLPEGWKMVHALDLDELGGFDEILLYRFILLDLDAAEAFDLLEVIRQVRMELMLNVPIFCFGGDSARRDEARLARADRFFERAEMVEKMQLYSPVPLGD